MQNLQDSGSLANSALSASSPLYTTQCAKLCLVSAREHERKIKWEGEYSINGTKILMPAMKIVILP